MKNISLERFSDLLLYVGFITEKEFLKRKEEIEIMECSFQPEGTYIAEQDGKKVKFKVEYSDNEIGKGFTIY